MTMHRSRFFGFLLLFLLPNSAFCESRIVNLRGAVTVYRAGGKIEQAEKTPFPVGGGDRVQTGPESRAVLLLDIGAMAELGEESNLILEQLYPESTKLFLKVGHLRSWVEALGERLLAVRTRTATCRVKGTEFLLWSHFTGRTKVDLLKGLLEVTDKRGETFTLKPGMSLETDFIGVVGEPRAEKVRRLPSPATSLAESARREAGLDMARTEVLSAAAHELKLAEHQQGKALIDVHGNRVRLEEYVVRPAADRFKLVVLNHRADRFDYFYYLGTFNKTLPTDLSIALDQLGGGLDSAPEYYLTAFEAGRSNTVDSIREAALGGHLVDLNGNADAADDVGSFFDARRDSYADASGRAAFKTLFDKYGFYVNGTLKYGWTGTNLQTYANRTWASANDPVTGAALGAALPVRSAVTSYPDAGGAHQRIFESYGDGTSITWDNYSVSDEGDVAPAAGFAGFTSGAVYRDSLLGFNLEQVVTASEFQGRKIDLVASPKFFIQTELIR